MEGWGNPALGSAEDSLQGTQCRGLTADLQQKLLGAALLDVDSAEGCMQLGNRSLVKDTAVYLSSSFIQLDAQTPWSLKAHPYLLQSNHNAAVGGLNDPAISQAVGVDAAADIGESWSVAGHSCIAESQVEGSQEAMR